MHDNTLAATLSKMGVDVQLIPTYTPIRTDEADVSADHVFFGGINVYLQQRVPLLCHLPSFLDRWLDHPAVIRWATSRGIQTDPRFLARIERARKQAPLGSCPLSLGFSMADRCRVVWSWCRLPWVRRGGSSQATRRVPKTTSLRFRLPLAELGWGSALIC